MRPTHEHHSTHGPFPVCAVMASVVSVPCVQSIEGSPVRRRQGGTRLQQEVSDRTGTLPPQHTQSHTRTSALPPYVGVVWWGVCGYLLWALEEEASEGPRQPPHHHRTPTTQVYTHTSTTHKPHIRHTPPGHLMSPVLSCLVWWPTCVDHAWGECCEDDLGGGYAVSVVRDSKQVG